MAEDSKKPERQRVFISYSHKDQGWKDRLVSHLKLLEVEGELSLWDDQQISAGDDSQREIEDALACADIAILLISTDYLTSDFIRGTEVPALLKRREKEGVWVIPILVKPCAWEMVGWLADLQIRPGKDRPLSGGSDHEIASDLTLLTREIRDRLRSGGVAPEVAAKRGTTEAGEQVWLVPYRRNPYFVGREDVLKRLRESITQDRTAALSQTQAISGLGGIGKTQTAIEYAYRYRDQYRTVLWTRAETEAELIAGFAEIAQALDLPEKDTPDQAVAVAAVRRWLATHGSWLLVLDNADSPDITEPYVPTVKRGHILLTSRAHSFDVLDVEPLALSSLSLREAKAFLLKRARHMDAVAEERQAVHELASELGCLPLALEQAAAYIAARQARFDDYLKSYRLRGLDLLAKGRPRNYPESVATTWALNFEQVEADSEASAEILRCCAFLAPEGIPLEFHTGGGPELGPILSEALKDAGDDPVILDDLLEPLIRFSLIERDVKDALDEDAQRFWAERCLRALDRVFPAVEFGCWAQCERLVPHAKALLREVEVHALHFEEAGHLLNLAGVYLWDRGRYREAEPLYESALRIREKALGAGHPDVAQSLNNLAALHSARGQYAEAAPLYRQALRMWEKALGPEHPLVSTSLNNLADLHRRQGQYIKAEPLYKRALEIREKALGPEHQLVSASLNSLADLHRAQEQYTEAEPLCERALRISEKALGAEHPQVAQSLNSLAQLHFDQRQYAEAAPLYERALRIREKALGVEHPDVAQSLNNLAALYYAQGEYAKAMPLHERALRIWQKVWGPEHPDVATNLHNLAELHRVQGEYAEAEPLYKHALHIWQKTLGVEHPDVATCLNNLAFIRYTKEEYAEAAPLCERALRIREKVLGSHHSLVATSLENYAALLRKINPAGGKTEIAEMEARAQTIRAKQSGTDG